MADQVTTDDTFDSSQPRAIVEAFIDGEAVDPRALRDALADAAAREHLVDLLMIRGALGAPDRAVLAGPRRASPILTASRSRARWLAAAAATVLVSLTVGYAAGKRLVEPASGPSAVELILPMEPQTSAPAPTRSITFTPGVNWIESSGGR